MKKTLVVVAGVLIFLLLPAILGVAGVISGLFGQAKVIATLPKLWRLIREAKETDAEATRAGRLSPVDDPDDR